MTDLSSLSNDELMQAAGMSPAPARGLSMMSNDDLMRIAGVQAKPSVDQLLGNPQDQAENIGRTIVGGASKLIPFGLGDELIAGGNAGLQGLLNLLPGESGPSMGETYDQTLNQVRSYQQAVHDISPTLSGVTDLSSAVAIPGAGSLISGAPGVTGKALAGAIEGAGLTGAYGFGEGQGTDARLRNLAKGGLFGLGVGGVGGTVAGLLDKGASAVSQYAEDVAPLSQEEAQLQQMGISRADIAKAQKFSNGASDRKLLDSANNVIERGTFADAADPIAMQQANEQAIGSLSDLMHGENGMLKAADAAQKDVAIPAFDKAQEFISKNPFQQEALSKQFADRMNTINQIWDGTISGLNKVKQFIGNIAYTGLTDSKDLDKAIYSDLKASIESQAEKAVPGLGSDIAKMNSQIGEHLTLRPVLQKAADAAIASGIKEGPAALPNIFGKAHYGTGTASLIALLTGHPVGAVAGLGASLAMKGLESDPGRMILSALLGGTSKVGQGLGALTEAAIPAEASAIARTALATAPKAIEKGLSIPASSLSPQFAKNDPTVAKIKSDPYAAAVFKTESGENPSAKNPDSSAKGAFQLIDSTAKRLGVNDSMDLKQNYEGFQKLTEENKKIFGNDPQMLYAAHYLGAPLLKKVIGKAPLTAKEIDQVQTFAKLALPHFQKNYQQAVG